MAMEGYIERKIRGDKVTSLTALKKEIAEIKRLAEEQKQMKAYRKQAEDNNSDLVALYAGKSIEVSKHIETLKKWEKTLFKKGGKNES